MDRSKKRELRSQNERAWNGEKDIIPVSKSLDSSLKKNGAFIKRLRTAISAATLSTFLQEIKTLGLFKFLSEIISACYEGLCKLKTTGEIEAAVEVVSALHQRFGPADFTEHLGWLLGKGMATPEKSLLKGLSSEMREREEKERMTRQRALLRVVTELWLVGVLRTLDDVRPDEVARVANGKEATSKPKPSGQNKGGGAGPFPLEVLKDLLGHDREHVNLPLLVTFVKTFGWDILAVKPAGSEGRKTIDEDGATKRRENGHGPDASPGTPTDPPFTSPELQQRFKNILTRYFEDVKAHLVRDHKNLVTQKGRNSEAYVKAGEVFEDRQANFERQIKAHERLVNNAQVLAEAVGAEMPKLKTTGDSAATNASIGLVKTAEYLRGQSDGAGIWEDDEERRFYENLADLKGKVPGMLLEEPKKKKADVDEQVGKRADSESQEPAKATETIDDQPTLATNKSIGLQLDGLLSQLPELGSKEAIDSMAIQFCFLNSKASRNRLIKALTEVPKGRTDLLPFWSRLVATLGQYFADIPKGLVDYLDAEFRSLQRRKEKDFLGRVRLINIRYLAELTKFGIVPEHVVFHCLRVSLDEFSRMNIEIIANLLENCGRYLLRNAETCPRMTAFMETLQRKKSVQHIGQQERMLIENAVYYVDPPERASIQQKERTPIELFIRKLIYVDMTKRNYAKVLKQIRKLHWEEKEVVAILAKVLSKPAKVKYGSIHLLAVLLSAIHRYHAEFVVMVIDRVLESICFGLEQPDYKFNQRRVAEVKFLGELYNYRMLDHVVIFDTLYRVMTFGHGGPPLPGRLTPFDMPDDFFRIRLAATLLETCGVFFNRGVAGKKLDYFLFFFQYYIHTKIALPMDIEFIVQDVYSLTRPQWVLASNLEEATKAFQLAIAQDQKSAGIDRMADQDDATSGGTSDDDNADVDGDELIPADDGDDESASGDDERIEDADSRSKSARGSDSENEEITVTRVEHEVDPEDEADFEREYAKLMAESLESRKFEHKPMFDVPLPVRPKTKEAPASDSTGRTGDKAVPNMMAFSLLTKKGNRQQTRTVELPSDSAFAVAMKNQQQAERQELQRIKNLTLKYDFGDDEDVDGDDSLASLTTNTNMHRSRNAGHERAPFHHQPNRSMGSNNNRERGGQRSRRLQLSDVEWYEGIPPCKASSGSSRASVQGGAGASDRSAFAVPVGENGTSRQTLAVPGRASGRQRGNRARRH